MEKVLRKRSLLQVRVSDDERQRIKKNVAAEQARRGASKRITLSNFVRFRLLNENYAPAESVRRHLRRIMENIDEIQFLASFIGHPQLTYWLAQLQQEITALDEEIASGNRKSQDR